MSNERACSVDRDSTWIVSSALAIVYTATAIVPLYLVGASAGTIQAHIGLTTSEFGYALSCYFATGALVSSRIGALVDRIPLRRALRIGMAFSAAASLVLALTADRWLLLAVGLALCGGAHAFTQLGTNRILAGQVSRRRALGFGLKQASIPVASLLAGFATAALSPPGDPTHLFLGAALLSSSLAALASRLVTSEGRPAPPAIVRVDRRPLYALAVAAGLAAGSGNTLSVLVVDSFNDQGFADRTGALVLALGSAAAVLARIATGLIVDRRQSDGRRELRAMLVAGAGCFALLALASGSPGTSIIGAVLAFGTGWGWPALVFFVASTQRDIPPATGSGLILSATMSGSIVAPLVVATLADNFGYGVAWGLGAVQLAMAALLIRPTRQRALSNSTTAGRANTDQDPNP